MLLLMAVSTPSKLAVAVSRVSTPGAAAAAMPGLDSRGFGIPAALLLLLLTPAAVAVLPIHCGNDNGNANGIGEMQECDTQGWPKVSRCRCSSSASSAAFAWLLLARHAVVARAPAGAEHSQHMYQHEMPQSSCI
jgi:hypothetical protein